MRVAIVHDWLTVIAGAERVLQQLLLLYPGADLFAVVDFLSESDREKLGGKRAKTTFVQKLPLARRGYRNYLPMMPLAIEQLDLRDYDLVLSSSHAVAKGVITTGDQLHLCYCHSPMRYAWDLHHQYVQGYSLKSWTLRYMLHRMRRWDQQSAARVDAFIANSHTVARRIWKTYRRESTVIHPPVDVEHLPFSAHKDETYLTVSRLVPYKRIDLLVAAFNAMPSRHLLIIGDGPEYSRIAKMIRSPHIELLGHQPDSTVHALMARARGFLFAAEEDFGIVPVEAMACGTPVIGYGRGGLTETVIDKETGLFFHEQSAEAIIAAIQAFERHSFDPHLCRARALPFSASRFRDQISHTVNHHWENRHLAISGFQAAPPSEGIYK
jgi:glycosyltransferase involved in cell wall biosynthesis